MGMVKHSQNAFLIFFYADKHQRFLQVEFNTLGIKVSFQVILSLLMGIIKHSQSTQSKKYLKKEVRDEVRFLHADKNQSFYKLVLSFWWKWSDMSQVPKGGSC